jgi:hypothetical protein
MLMILMGGFNHISLRLLTYLNWRTDTHWIKGISQQKELGFGMPYGDRQRMWRSSKRISGSWLKGARGDFAIGHLILIDGDGAWRTLPGSLPDFLLQWFWDKVHQDPCDKLVFIIFKDFRADLVAIAIPHA